mgnify:FL=1
MEKNYNVLSECVIFRHIKKGELGCLVSCLEAKVRKYKAGQYIFLAGDKLNYIQVVLSGLAEVIKENLAGNKHIIAMLQPSDLFAEGIVCTESKISPVTVRAKQDMEVLLIPHEKIIRTCGRSCTYHIGLIQNMMVVLGEKNSRLNEKIELLTLKGMREKIASYLVNEMNDRKKNSFEIMLNRTQLAEYLNVSRTSMSRELSRMKEDGLIDYSGKKFKILDEDRLMESIGA